MTLRDIQRDIFPYISLLLKEARMCPRCLEDGFIEWVQVYDTHACNRGAIEPDEQFCARCNTRWGKNQCIEIAALLQGVLYSKGVEDETMGPLLVSNILYAQERRDQDIEKREPAYKYDTRDGWDDEKLDR